MVRLIAAVALLACACAQDGLEDPVELPAADGHFFRCNVQPVLAARCSFMECHGNGDRPLIVFAEQRLRAGVSWDEFDTPLTDDELQANFKIARGFIARKPGDEHQISDKPLDTRAGGLFHRGRDLYGADDVFLSRDDVGYQILKDFAEGATAPVECEPREDVGL